MYFYPIKLGVSGACKTVPRAIQRHINSKLVAEWGSKAVINLAVDDSNRAKLGDYITILII